MTKKDVFDGGPYPKISLDVSNYFSNLFSGILGSFGDSIETKYRRNNM